jgi:hypothetical protein
LLTVIDGEAMMTWGRILVAATALLTFAPPGPAIGRPGTIFDTSPRVVSPPAARAYAQWPFRRFRESRPIPPRGIPGGRSAELDKRKAPLPRPRPDDITGSIKIVPVAPFE